MNLPFVSRRRHRQEKRELAREIKSLRTTVHDLRFTVEELKKFAWDRLERLGLMDLRSKVQGESLTATYTVSKGMLYSLWTPFDEKQMAHYVAQRLVREIVAFQVKEMGHGFASSDGPPFHC